MLVGYIDDGFDDGAELTFGDFVCEGVDDDAARAECGFVELCLVRAATTEAGVVPDEEPLWAE